MLQTTQYLTTLYIIDSLKDTTKKSYVAIATDTGKSYKTIIGKIDDINENIVKRLFNDDNAINRTLLRNASSYIFDIYTKPGKKLPFILDDLSIFTLCTEDVYLSEQPIKHDIKCVLLKNRYGSLTIDDKSNKYYIADKCLHAKNNDFVLDLTKLTELV